MVFADCPDFTQPFPPRLSAEQAAEIAVEDARNTVCLDPECSGHASTDSVGDSLLALYYDILDDDQSRISLARPPSLLISGKRLLYELTVRLSVGDCYVFCVDVSQSVKSQLASGFSTLRSTATEEDWPLRRSRLSERTKDFAEWVYWIDATSGGVVYKYNAIEYSNPPNDTGYHTTVTGCILANEVNPATNDSVVSIMGWRDSGVTDTNYFLYYKGDSATKSGAWGVFDNDYGGYDTGWIQSASGDWGTTDRHAISAARWIEAVQHWFRDSLDRWSWDDSGSLLAAYIHWATPDEASSQNGALHFGDGASTQYSVITCDILAHEAGHAITSATSTLQFSYHEPGALAESFSDIVGASLEFVCQPNSTSLYPATSRGCSDWLFGEDQGFSYVALRDFRFPQRLAEGGTVDSLVRGGQKPYATYYDGTGFWEDSLGSTTSCTKYSKLGVQNFVFYLVAEGSDTTRDNDGHPYGPFRGIGWEGASRLAMRANMVYLAGHSTYRDSRLAWLKASVDLVDEGQVPAYTCTIVDSAWDAVGVFAELRVRYDGRPLAQVGQSGYFKLAVDDEQTTLRGLRFVHAISGKGVSLSDTTSRLQRSGALLPCDSAFLADSTLSSFLVFRSPSGSAHLAIDSSGNMRTWGRKWNLAF